MPDYQFYREVYEGTELEEARFCTLAKRGDSWLQKLERCCRVTPYGPNSRKMAVCAIAETLHAWDKKHQYLEASIGGVRVRYQQSDLPLQRQLLQNVGGYLDIYRAAAGSAR